MEHTFLLTKKEKVFAYGENGTGQLGVGEIPARYPLGNKGNTPLLVKSISEPIIAIASGDTHFLALSKKGVVFA